MERQEYSKSSIEKIRDCLQDYSNDFIAPSLSLEDSGIKGVRKLIKNGYRVATVEGIAEKYRKEGRETISVENQKNPLFIKKAKELNELANRINSLGENIKEQDIKEIMDQVTEIIHF